MGYPENFNMTDHCDVDCSPMLNSFKDLVYSTPDVIHTIIPVVLGIMIILMVLVMTSTPTKIFRWMMRKIFLREDDF